MNNLVTQKHVGIHTLNNNGSTVSTLILEIIVDLQFPEEHATLHTYSF
jgi:hypothetical protein